jgi:PTH1 family peptidyl-tRNA hydrolase
MLYLSFDMSIVTKRGFFNRKLNWGSSEPAKLEGSIDSPKPDADSFIKLIVGLGNIGKQYIGTRHNIGFDIIDSYAKSESFPDFKESKKFFGATSEKFVGGKKIILLKPTTLMNLSGKSIRAISDFYKIEPKDITVLHDELDLDFGTIKLKNGGAGLSSHNGLKSIKNQLSSTDFKRIRFGIKNDLLEKMDTADFVLSRFSKAEQSQLKDLILEAIKLI